MSGRSTRQYLVVLIIVVVVQSATVQVENRPSVASVQTRGFKNVDSVTLVSIFSAYYLGLYSRKNLF